MPFDVTLELRPEESTATRVLVDPRAALAHPRRVRLLRELRTSGPATATMLGAATRQSAASASYHLRQLESSGFVDQVPNRGVGRERWWQARASGSRIDLESFRAPQKRTAAVAVAAALLSDANHVAVTFLDAVERGDVEPAWIDAARFDDITVQVPADELAHIGRRIAEILEPYARTARAAPSPHARTCNVWVQALPVVR